MITNIEAMRLKPWIQYTAVYWWKEGGVSPLVIPYKTIDGVLRKFREEGGTSYRVVENTLEGSYSPDNKGWTLTISSHHMFTDEGKYEDDR